VVDQYFHEPIALSDRPLSQRTEALQGLAAQKPSQMERLATDAATALHAQNLLSQAVNKIVAPQQIPQVFDLSTPSMTPSQSKATSKVPSRDPSKARPEKVYEPDIAYGEESINPPTTKRPPDVSEDVSNLAKRNRMVDLGNLSGTIQLTEPKVQLAEPKPTKRDLRKEKRNMAQRPDVQRAVETLEDIESMKKQAQAEAKPASRPQSVQKPVPVAKAKAKAKAVPKAKQRAQSIVKQRAAVPQEVVARGRAMLRRTVRA
jgi:hypothetical protein